MQVEEEGSSKARAEEARIEAEKQKKIEEENQKALAEKVAEEKRIEEENRRIKEWEIKLELNTQF